MAPKTTKGGKPKTKSKKNKGGGKSESELQEEKERLELIEKLALLEAEKNRDVALTEELENQTSHLKDDWEISKKEKRVSISYGRYHSICRNRSRKMNLTHAFSPHSFRRICLAVPSL